MSLEEKNKKIRPGTLQTATSSLSCPAHLSHPHRVPPPRTLPITVQSHSSQQPESVDWGAWTHSAVATKELHTGCSTHWHQLWLHSAESFFPTLHLCLTSLSQSSIDNTNAHKCHYPFLRTPPVLVLSDYTDVLILKYYKHQL